MHGTVALDVNHFWNLLTDSQLVSAAQVQSLFNEFASDKKVDRDTEGLAKWLVGKNALSPYQSEILLAGHAGPFRFGAYSLVDRIHEGALADGFTAFHRSSGYRVLLEFLPGDQPQDLDYWQQVNQQCGKLRKLKVPFSTEIFDADAIPGYRFTVSDIPGGKALSQMPHKSRLPWEQTCAVMVRVGKALSVLHEQDLCHGALSSNSIWINSGSDARLRLMPVASVQPLQALPEWQQLERLKVLAPEIDSQVVPQAINAPAEVYSFACLLVRLLTARDFCTETQPDEIRKFHQDATPPDLSKYDVPEGMDTLIGRMLASDPSSRPTIAEATNLLALHSGNAAVLDASDSGAPIDSKLMKKRAAFVASLRPGIDDFGDELIPVAIDLGEEPEGETLDASERIKLAHEKAELRKKGKWKVPVAIALGLVALMGGIAGLSYYLNAQVTEPISQSADGGSQGTASDKQPGQTSAEPETPVDVEADGDQRYAQKLIEDDALTLWESPTAGLADPCNYLPTAPKMILQVRLAALLATDEGPKILQSMGPEMSESLKRVQGRWGIPFDEIQHLTVSFHDDEQVAYDQFAIITTNGISQTRLLELWNNPTAKQTESGQRFFEAEDGLAYWIIKSGTAVAPETLSESGSGDEASQTRFAVGPSTLIQEVAASGGGIPLAGPMQELAGWTDIDRHLNFVFLRPSLFNDRGQGWMGETLAAFNRELSVMIPDGVQGGLVGFHVDDGSYLEVRFNRIADLSAGGLKQVMLNEMKQQTNQIADHIAGIYPNAYWDRVRVKFMAMVLEVSRNFRWSVERGEVVGNAWLPAPAAHNLIASSELILSFAGGATAPVVSANEAPPKSIEDLLQRKRDLVMSNPPDLNVLMSDLKQEIDSDFGGLPFSWDIKLRGGDLEKDGITKNQRPSELNMQQMSLAEILTSIMVSANPDKDITGAADPKCKLIWVVAEDPDKPGQKAILITTRAAAEANGYTLPQPFVPK